MKRPPGDRSQVGTSRFITRRGVDARTGARLIGSGLATSRIASQVGRIYRRDREKRRERREKTLIRNKLLPRIPPDRPGFIMRDAPRDLRKKAPPGGVRG